jgi:hypothetical protein
MVRSAQEQVAVCNDRRRDEHLILEGVGRDHFEFSPILTTITSPSSVAKYSLPFAATGDASVGGFRQAHLRIVGLAVVALKTLIIPLSVTTYSLLSWRTATSYRTIRAFDSKQSNPIR